MAYRADGTRCPEYLGVQAGLKGALQETLRVAGAPTSIVTLGQFMELAKLDPRSPKSADQDTARAIDLMFRGHDCIHTEYCQLGAGSIPPQVDDALFTALQRGAAFYFQNYAVVDVDDAGKVRSTGAYRNYAIFGDILRRMTRATNASAAARGLADTLPLYLYSAHDSNVLAAVRGLLGNTTYNQDWPPYASIVAFELYRNRTAPEGPAAYQVMVSYNGVKLPVCERAGMTTNEDGLCSLEHFSARLRQFTAKEPACSAAPAPAAKGRAKVSGGLVIALVVLLIASIISNGYQYRSYGALKESINSGRYADLRGDRLTDGL